MLEGREAYDIYKKKEANGEHLKQLEHLNTELDSLYEKI